MTLAARIILIVTLVMWLAAGVSAQETTTAATDTTAAAPTTTTVAPAASTRPGPQIREDFNRVLGQHPAEVGRVLGLDPTLVSNAQFLSSYPELAHFIAQYPEIRRNPHYYLRDYAPQNARREPAPFEEAVESVSIAAVFFLIAFALAWLVRTTIEQKRWNQLSRRQSEVHNKILDRFSSSEELLAYIKTPAGTKFLESAPIPVRAETPVPNTPYNRVMWSIQIGVVVAVGAFGMLLASFRFEKETAHGLFAMGVIGFCIGAGFIASAVVSLILSKRLSSWQLPASEIDDAGGMR